MKSRCLNPCYNLYSFYGGRGITICSRWIESFESFVEDMGERPSKDHTLDRIDSNGNYEPSNCRWATRSEQLNNRRNTLYFLYDGERLTLKEICVRNGVNRADVYIWLYKGRSLEEAIFLAKNPPGRGRKKQ